MTQTLSADVTIIGTGPAGYTAALYASRGELNTRIISGMQPGGQLTITSDVENYPGFAKAIQGPWLMSQMEQQATHFGAHLDYDLITSVKLKEGEVFELKGDSGNIYTSKAVIIATGARARWLGLPKEEELRGKGISACATCDGAFFRNKHVAVVGGGNTAASDALHLAKFASHVTLIHRRDTMKCEKILQKRLQDEPKISFIWNHQVKEYLSAGVPEKLTGLVLENVKNGEQQKLPVDGLFVAIGHVPQTEIFKNDLDMDKHGYILTAPDSTKTSRSGVFAAGDVQDSIYQQAVTAAGSGCMAAMEAQNYLAAQTS